MSKFLTKSGNVVTVWMSGKLSRRYYILSGIPAFVILIAFFFPDMITLGHQEMLPVAGVVSLIVLSLPFTINRGRTQIHLNEQKLIHPQGIFPFDSVEAVTMIEEERMVNKVMMRFYLLQLCLKDSTRLVILNPGTTKSLAPVGEEIGKMIGRPFQSI